VNDGLHEGGSSLHDNLALLVTLAETRKRRREAAESLHHLYSPWGKAAAYAFSFSGSSEGQVSVGGASGDLRHLSTLLGLSSILCA